MEISLPSTRSVKVGTVYRPPDDNMFFENLETVLDKMANSGSGSPSELTCIGDFNVDALNVHSSQWIKLKNIFSIFQMHQVDETATRVTDHSSTCIDHFWANLHSLYLNQVVVDFNFSDHSLIFTSCKRTQRFWHF